MTPKERALDFMLRWRSYQGPPLMKEDFTNWIEHAITAAIEEDRKSRPHEFIGSIDRDCELCGNPDRDGIHFVKRERMGNAIKQEREAILQIIREQAGYGARNAEYTSACNAIEGKIRARS